MHVLCHSDGLENEWEAKGVRQSEFVRMAQDSLNDQVGKIPGHKLGKSGCKEGTIFKIMQILYLDDRAFIFDPRNDLIKGVNIINSPFTKIGMEMHVGRNEKAPKTQCI